jgi:hypothetical protein
MADCYPIDPASACHSFAREVGPEMERFLGTEEGRLEAAVERMRSGVELREAILQVAFEAISRDARHRRLWHEIFGYAYEDLCSRAEGKPRRHQRQAGTARSILNSLFIRISDGPPKSFEYCSYEELLNWLVKRYEWRSMDRTRTRRTGVAQHTAPRSETLLRNAADASADGDPRGQAEHLELRRLAQERLAGEDPRTREMARKVLSGEASILSTAREARMNRDTASARIRELLRRILPG